MAKNDDWGPCRGVPYTPAECGHLGGLANAALGNWEDNLSKAWEMDELAYQEHLQRFQEMKETSEAFKAASRENGKLGGRPRGS